MYLINEVPESTGAMAAFPYSKALEEKFEFYSPFDGVVSMGIRRGGLLYVPREYAPVGKVDYRVKKESKPFPYSITYREGQQEAIEKSTNLLLEGKNHILEAPTGWGKTLAGCCIALNVGQPTLITVSKTDLLTSWRSSLKILGFPSELVGHVQQSVCDYKGKQIIFGLVQTLMDEGRYEKDFYNYFGMLLTDEAHHMAAECFVRICEQFPAYYRLGLSATPKRADKKDPLLYGHIGKVMVRALNVPMKPKILVKKTGWEIPLVPTKVNGEWKMAKMFYTPGKMMGVYKKMAASKQRNEIIVKFVVQAFNSGRRVLIVSDLIKGHLDILGSMLCKELPPTEIDYYIGGRSELQLSIAKKKKVVLGTYAMVGEGTDVPEWDTLVMATPRVQAKQVLGRILRFLEGKKTPVCLDLVDSDGIFHGYYRKREQQYYSLEGTVVKL